MKTRVLSCDISKCVDVTRCVVYVDVVKCSELCCKTELLYGSVYVKRDSVMSLCTSLNK